MNYRYSREAADRARDRRDREDTATRLQTLVPQLRSLKLVLTEVDGERKTTMIQYTKLVVVARAPALFEFRCGDTDCEGGTYDLTRPIMNALQASRAEFSGDQRCRGTRWNAPCNRQLVFQATASYEAPAPSKEP